MFIVPRSALGIAMLTQTVFVCVLALADESLFMQKDCFPTRRTSLCAIIQFPKTVDTVPGVRIYYKGQRIRCDIDQETRRINFSIPADEGATSLDIVVTDSLSFVAHNNVVEYLKVARKKPYKFYVAELERGGSAFCFLEAPYDDGVESEAGSSGSASWYVEEIPHALEGGRIPDEAIILCFKPSYIDSVSGGSLSTPLTINIRPDVVAVAGSEKKLHEIADELLLSSLDYDALHAVMRQEVHYASNPKTIVAMTT